MKDIPGLIIRDTLPEDLAGIMEIERSCFSSEAWSEGDFLYRLDKPEFVTLTAAFDGEVAGYIAVTGVCDASVDSVAVSKKFRRLGIASRLMIEALSRCGETAFLEVRESNKPAIELYKSLGFRKIGVRRGYYDSPEEDAVVMSRE